MLELAKDNSVKIVTLDDYEQAHEEIRITILDTIGKLLKVKSGEGSS
jgi:hypothetical protein